MRHTLFGLTFLAAACGDHVASTPDAAAPAPDAAAAPDGPSARHLDHVFLIMMENHGTDEIIGNTADAPFINELASHNGVAFNYFGVTHPSLPNYLALFSGDFQGIWDDCKAGSDVTCAPEEFVTDSGDNTDTLLLTQAQIDSASAIPHLFTGPNLVDRLEDASLTWRAYMQSIPGVGDTSEFWPYDATTGAPRKLYAQKHDPFMYFADIRSSDARMSKIVPGDQLQADLDSGDVPTFVWISPDQCHDMHGLNATNAAAVGIPDCATPATGLDHSVIALGDAYLAETVFAITQSKAWQEDSAIVIVWDEDDYAGYAGCCGSPTTTGGAVLGGARAPAIVLASRSPRHVISTLPRNHYSLLATIESLWGLPCLGQTCNLASGDLMTDLFGR